MSKSVAKNVHWTERGRCQVFFEDGFGMTQQHFKDECDVNYLLRNYGAQALLEHNAEYQGQYGDFTEVQDYQTSLNQIIAAQDMFDSLPSNIRNRFANDPGLFLDFVSNEANRDEMRSLGLLKPEVQEPNLVPLAQPEFDKTAPE